MIDLMMEIYRAFREDEELSPHIESISFFDYPNANEITRPIIVIDDLTTPIPTDFADDDYLSHTYIYQIDLFIKQNNNENGRLLSSRLILRIQKIMWEQLGFHVSMSGKPDYLKDFNLFRTTISFSGKKYNREMEQ